MSNKIERLTTQLGKKLKDRHLSLVTVESCTGGGLAHYISKNPETSSILERGYVTYSLQSKEALSVPAYELQVFGPVSKAVALSMAKGGLAKSVAHIAIAITGIAGSDTDIAQEKAGIVWIACTSQFSKPFAAKKIIAGKREDFCEKVILQSLLILLKYVDRFY